MWSQTGHPCANLRASLVARWWSPPAVQELQKTWVQSLDQEDPLEGFIATHFQHSCLQNPMDRGASQATVHRITKSQT